VNEYNPLASPNNVYYADTGWLISKGGIIKINNPIDLSANRYLFHGIGNDLVIKASGIGTGAIIGLEMKVFKLRMSLEADCSNINYGKDKQRGDLFEKFSFGLSYRLGLKLGNYFTPYALAGLEFNTLSEGSGDNVHFYDAGIIAYIRHDGAGARELFQAHRAAYNLDAGKIIHSPKFGCGLEIGFFERFRFRCEAFWTMKRRFVCNFATSHGPDNAAGGVNYFAFYQNKMTLLHKKFSTCFGIIMDL
jgi:opacity protein-like surface antigen